MDVHSDTAFAPFIDAPAADSSVLLRDLAYERIKDAFASPACSPVSPFQKHAFLANSALAARRFGKPCSCWPRRALCRLSPAAQ